MDWKSRVDRGSLRAPGRDFWRAGYARAIAATPEVRSYRIWRGQDDPNYVITAENFDSRVLAERVWTSEDLAGGSIKID